jgi:hypothetical protein
MSLKFGKHKGRTEDADQGEPDAEAPVAEATEAADTTETAEASDTTETLDPAATTDASGTTELLETVAVNDVAETTAAATTSTGSLARLTAKLGPVKKLNSLPPAGRRPWVVATAAGAAAVIAIGVIVVASGGHPATATASTANTTTKKHSAAQHKAKPAAAVSLVSVSPSNDASSVDGASPITVTYSGDLAATAKLPTVSPHISGSWQISGDKAIFTPDAGYKPGTHVTVHVPATGTTKARSIGFTTGQYSTLRLQQLLAELGYLPVSWTPTDPTGDVAAADTRAQLSAAYSAPSGTFTFHSGYPSTLTSKWSAGTDNIIVQGAVWTFEYDHNLTMDGVAGAGVWQALFHAVATSERNTHGYTYVSVSQSGTQHLTLYHNGRMRLSTLVNTGIAGRGTADGTYPVFLRYDVTIMQGTNPDGSKYKDTVQWVSYFNGGDAVHYFPRYSYGSYQSLGCVELPYDPAVTAFKMMTYGTLVTVTGPEA